MTCSRSIGDQGIFGSKLPVLIIINYVLVNNLFFFKAGEKALKTFYKRKLALDIFVINKHLLLFLIPSLLCFFFIAQGLLEL